ncbi:hypothetical protein [Gordonia humi]|uniref:Uncharacterized protein n=1 Tax=Gordonia humi TaxID=686429 RepID=A0A840ESX5_9ACTN|nr:hypothetical protein [Gordonia humi]MBB4133478.1 hypothetical protein [Gordonia humi]
MSKRNKARANGRRARRRAEDASDRRLAHRLAAANPVWTWCCVATELSRRHGHTDERWFTLMMEFRPWREQPDGTRDRWTIADAPPGALDEIDDILDPYRICDWYGTLTWDEKRRCHRMVPGGSRCLGAGPFMSSPDCDADAELCDAARLLRDAFYDFEDAVAAHDEAHGTRLIMSDDLRTVIASLEVVTDIADGVDRQFDLLRRRAVSAAATIAART